ncbi:four and a half LIM domains protein 2-like isoform X1 [Bolinopsis microptera]|uniref:four and a half LIM domains protein 2-like isoform X1 n=1 Tax=Bolinopsis microptera TaxID=2820187 RepID=UPI003078FE28
MTGNGTLNMAEKSTKGETLCAGCSKPIGMKWVVALDQKWHRYCFSCDSCKMPIDSKKSFFFDKGVRTCVDCAKKDDPSIGESKTCQGCGEAIDKAWVIGLGNTWHSSCFKCTECTRVIDPKEKFFKVEVDGKHVPKCGDCKVTKGVAGLDVKEKVCAGCEKEIESAWVVALNKHWHHDCFKCSHCDRKIDSKEQFLTNLGNPVCMGCNNDHFRSKCAVCSKPIAGTSLIYKESSFHHACVNCYVCDEAFKVGDHENIRIVNGKDFKHADCKK